MISYKINSKNYIDVILDNKLVGQIKPVSERYAYFPKGKYKLRGDTFKTTEDVKKSLEEE